MLGDIIRRGGSSAHYVSIVHLAGSLGVPYLTLPWIVSMIGRLVYCNRSVGSLPYRIIPRPLSELG